MVEYEYEDDYEHERWKLARKIIHLRMFCRCRRLQSTADYGQSEEQSEDEATGSCIHVYSVLLVRSKYIGTRY